jgi:hypothetical protein
MGLKDNNITECSNQCYLGNFDNFAHLPYQKIMMGMIEEREDSHFLNAQWVSKIAKA